MSNTLTRRTILLGAAGAFGALSIGAAAAEPTSQLSGRKITSELVLQIKVKLGETEDMGLGSDGHRINYPITGGTFTGKGLKGIVIPGGADMSVERSDGVTMIEALYRLKTDDGNVIIIHNPGIWRPNESGLRKIKNKENLLESDFYSITQPSFKTPPGKYNWLTQNIFVGTIDDIKDYGVLISCYLINQSV